MRRRRQGRRFLALLATFRRGERWLRAAVRFARRFAGPLPFLPTGLYLSCLCAFFPLIRLLSDLGHVIMRLLLTVVDVAD